jgi:hypothetical protein
MKPRAPYGTAATWWRCSARAGIEVVDKALLPSYTATPFLLQIFSLVKISLCSNGKSTMGWCSVLFQSNGVNMVFEGRGEQQEKLVLGLSRVIETPNLTSSLWLVRPCYAWRITVAVCPTNTVCAGAHMRPALARLWHCAALTLSSCTVRPSFPGILVGSRFLPSSPYRTPFFLLSF